MNAIVFFHEVIYHFSLKSTINSILTYKGLLLVIYLP